MPRRCRIMRSNTSFLDNWPDLALSHGGKVNLFRRSGVAAKSNGENPRRRGFEPTGTRPKDEDEPVHRKRPIARTAAAGWSAFWKPFSVGMASL